MTRYTINIGDDFPIGDDDDEPKHGDATGPNSSPGQRRRGPRFGTVLRILFAVSLIAVVVHHAFQVAIITGLILLFRRNPRFQEFRSRMRGMAGGMPWSAMAGGRRHCGPRGGRHSHERHEHGGDEHGSDGRGRGERGREKRGYESFV